MWDREISMRGEKSSVNWVMLLVSVVVIHLVLIGSMEMLYFVLTGGVSPLVAGFGLVAAVLVSVRKIGETLCGPPCLGRSTWSD